MLKIQDPDLENLLNYLARQDEFVYLDTSRPDDENVESLLFLEPVDRLICRAGENLENYLAVLQAHLTKGFYLAGWVGYEFGAMLEGRMRVGNSRHPLNQLVLADFGVFLKPNRFDHNTGENNFPFEPHCGPSGGEYNITGLRPNMEKEEFLEILNKVREYIVAGDTIR
jgi:para-aminobenzoate synthetase/4-amino-4-deoxychorismate lyase